MLRDLERLLSAVGLRYEKVVNIYAQLPGIFGIHRMLGVYIGGAPSGLLGLGYHMQSKRGLTGTLRPVDLHNATPRNATYPGRRIDTQTAGRDHGHIGHFLVAKTHDRSLTKLLLYLRQRHLYSSIAFCFQIGHNLFHSSKTIIFPVNLI